MLIGIDGSRAFLKQRTGIEEYSYQVIKHLRHEVNDSQARLAPDSPSLGGSTSGFRESRRVVLYLRADQKVDFTLPERWRMKKLWSPWLWTQFRLSLELLLNPVDVLFIPSHTVPPIHPKRTIVTIHGLEYEFVPNAYSWWARLYMRTVIKNSCHWAKKIIAVSENTRQDLVNLYKVPEEKIEVIYEGYANPKTQNLEPKTSGYGLQVTGYGKFLLFIGRLEERKNILGIIEAFEILKEKYKIPHKLVLVGKFGYGEWEIHQKLKNINCSQDIISPGFVNETEKWQLIKNADVFLFPTFYEGFGLPILEAQSVGVPVVASNNSSIPEVVKIPPSPPFTKGENTLSPFSKGRVGEGFSALLVDPKNPTAIAEAAYKLISDKNLKDDIIKKGYENIKRFSWDKCAGEIARLIQISE